MPTWPRPSKKTRSPGCSWSRETGTPAPYCAYDECGSETPTCAYAHITSPEQSKPPGEAPPQAYGVPSWDIATPAAPPCVEGGATTVSACGAMAVTPTTVSCACCCDTRCASCSRCWAATAIWSWRAWSAATSCAICPLIDESRLFAWLICDSIDDLAAARSVTTRCSEVVDRIADQPGKQPALVDQGADR